MKGRNADLRFALLLFKMFQNRQNYCFKQMNNIKLHHHVRKNKNI